MDIRSPSELVLRLELGNVGNYSGRNSMLNISLPNQIIDFIERQAIADGFNTPSEYVFHILLREQERLGQQDRVESLLIEGLDSGESVEVTDDWWNSKRAALDALHRS
jgi:antitoxin ParD1/3/4